MAGLINPNMIFLFGKNLGGSVAAYMAHKNPNLFAGLILDNTPTSILDMFHLYFFESYM